MNPLYDCGEATKNLQCGIAWHLGQAGQGAAIYNVSTEGGVGPRHRTQLTDLGGWGGRVQNSHNVVDFIYGRPPRCKLDYQVL